MRFRANNYRKQVADVDGIKLYRRGFTCPEFEAVEGNWDLQSKCRTVIWQEDPERELGYTHTLEYRFKIVTPNGPSIVRGHVHYNSERGYKAIPGHFWVEGVKGYDCETPDDIVDRFADEALVFDSTSEEREMDAAEARAEDQAAEYSKWGDIEDRLMGV